MHFDTGDNDAPTNPQMTKIFPILNLFLDKEVSKYGQITKCDQSLILMKLVRHFIISAHPPPRIKFFGCPPLPPEFN